MDVQVSLERLLNGGGGGNVERELQPAPPQRRVPPPKRDEPPITSTTAQCAAKGVQRALAQKGADTPAQANYQRLHRGDSATWKERKRKVVRAYGEGSGLNVDDQCRVACG